MATEATYVKPSPQSDSLNLDSQTWVLGKLLASQWFHSYGGLRYCCTYVWAILRVLHFCFYSV